VKVKVKMPKLGLTMREAKIVEWKKAAGDQVAAGEIMLVIETDKADVEIEAPASGAVAEIIGAVAGVYQIGDVIAVIDVPGPR
jgi:pyruvate/2-oxoglutarate dehydrogenase complex dihydrolipoamide acyltransferase (E2) component